MPIQIPTGAWLGGQIINSLGGIANGQDSTSDSWNTSQGTSDSSSWESGFSDSYSQSDSYSNSTATGRSASESYGQGEGMSAVYGSEANAQDIMRAAEANAEQWELLKAQMQYNSMEAEKARAWEEAMSNSAYQRAIADLRKAGLNPILAAGNLGATTPVAAYGSSGLATAYKANTLADQRSYNYNSSGSYSKSTYDAQSHSESHSTSSSHSENSGGSRSHSQNSSNGGSHSESKPWAVKAIENITKNGTEAIKNMYNGGSGKSYVDGYDVPLN